MGGCIGKYFDQNKYTDEENEKWDAYQAYYNGGSCKTCNDGMASKCECAKKRYIKNVRQFKIIV